MKLLKFALILILLTTIALTAFGCARTMSIVSAPCIAIISSSTIVMRWTPR